VVFHGDADTLVPPSGGEATARAIPGARLVIVPNLGHEIPPGAWSAIVGAIVTNANRAGHWTSPRLHRTAPSQAEVPR
jgi:pimeloyl-ACP methyl ester carboxylesterase